MAKRKFVALVVTAASALLLFLTVGAIDMASGRGTINRAILSSVRGTDQYFYKTAQNSCDQMAVSAYGVVTSGGFSYAASDCNSLNLGQTCGQCDSRAVKTYGTYGLIIDPGSGQWNDLSNCGNAWYGTCTATTLPGGGTTYGCGSLVALTQGDPPVQVTCSAIMTMTNQSGN
jgi:hypothetical protein